MREVHLSVHDADRDTYDKLKGVFEEKSGGQSTWVDITIGGVELTVFKPWRSKNVVDIGGTNG